MEAYSLRKVINQGNVVKLEILKTLSKPVPPITTASLVTDRPELANRGIEFNGYASNGFDLCERSPSPLRDRQSGVGVLIFVIEHGEKAEEAREPGHREWFEKKDFLLKAKGMVMCVEGREYVPEDIGTWILPYPFTIDLPKKSSPSNDTTTCGQPEGLFAE